MGLLSAFLGAFAAACSDLETGKIPNALVLCLWAAGIMTALCGVPAAGATGSVSPEAGMAAGLTGFGSPACLERMLGAGAPLAVLAPLFRRGLMGAGDIKLLSGLGGLIGLRGIAVCFAVSVASASVISVFLILEDGFARARYVRVHFAVPILMGVMVVCMGV